MYICIHKQELFLLTCYIWPIQNCCNQLEKGYGDFSRREKDGHLEMLGSDVRAVAGGDLVDDMEEILLLPANAATTTTTSPLRRSHGGALWTEAGLARGERR